MKTRSARRWSALAGLVALVGSFAILVQPAAAVGETVVATPSSNLLDGQVINVDVTTTGTTDASVFVAVTQCGNANSSGTPLAALDPAGNDCVTAEGLGSTLQLIGFPTGAVTPGTHSTSLTLKKTNIGVNGSQCIPMPPATLPCTIVASTASAAGAYTGPNYNFQAATPITYRPAPTVSISSVTGQAVATAARAGDTINLTGANWDDIPPSTATVTLALCNTSGSACDATGLTGVTAGVTGGTLTASGVVDGSATTGARPLKGTQRTLSALAPIQILGNRTVILNPNAGGANTNVLVTASGFNAGVPVAISGLTSAFAPTTDPPVAPVASSGTGGVSSNFTVVDPNTAYIAVAELSSPTVLNAFAPFTFSGNQCTPAGQVTSATVPTTGGGDGNTATNDGCSLLQTVTQDVNGDVLVFSQADNQITMGAVTLNGSDQTTTGTINELTVLDARGSLVGWTVNATMTDLQEGAGGLHHVIPAGNLSASNVTCAPRSASTGDASDVAANAGGGALSGTTALTLCTAASGGGGGTFDINSNLSLLVPASVAAGLYTGTMTLTVT